MTSSVADRLGAGPARGLGCAKQIAAEASRNSEKMRKLVAAVRDPRDTVVIRAANALREVQKTEPERLAPFAKTLLQSAAACEVLQARWNLVQIVAELPLRGRERAVAIDIFFSALESPSGFLRAFALTGLAKAAMQDATLRRRVLPMLATAEEDASAAVRARARKLTAELRRLKPA